MAKVTFSARKDPLLRPRRTAEPETTPSDGMRVEAQGTPSDDEKRVEAHSSASDEKRVETLTEVGRRGRAGTPASTPRSGPRPVRAAAVEGPAGVVSIAPHDAGPPAPAQPAPATADPSGAPQRAGHARRARRVQTSISLPSDVWDKLDELAESAGVPNGQLLTAILTAALPDSPESAFSAVEQLLLSDAPDNAGHEERNYRLPLHLRANLDSLASALGSRPRPQRSLLIHALVAAHAPSSADQARELITTQRIEALRAAMRESAAD